MKHPCAHSMTQENCLGCLEGSNERLRVVADKLGKKLADVENRAAAFKDALEQIAFGDCCGYCRASRKQQKPPRFGHGARWTVFGLAIG